MSEDETMHGAARPEAGLTEEYPTIASGLMTPEGESGDLSLEGDSDDEWPTRGPARGVRLALPTVGIVAVLLVAAGFWGGAVLEKSRHSSSAGGASALAASFRSGLAGTGGTGAPSFAGGGFPGGGGGFGGTSSSAATGTVSVVDGNTLYILTSAGSLVKVTLGASTTITRNSTTQADGLRPGDTVVVQGTTAKKTGDVTATSISATAAGVGAAG